MTKYRRKPVVVEAARILTGWRIVFLPGYRVSLVNDSDFHDQYEPAATNVTACDEYPNLSFTQPSQPEHVTVNGVRYEPVDAGERKYIYDPYCPPGQEFTITGDPKHRDSPPYSSDPLDNPVEGDIVNWEPIPDYTTGVVTAEGVLDA